jgi:hypothetical protein
MYRFKGNAGIPISGPGFCVIVLIALQLAKIESHLHEFHKIISITPPQSGCGQPSEPSPSQSGSASPARQTKPQSGHFMLTSKILVGVLTSPSPASLLLHSQSHSRCFH